MAVHGEEFDQLGRRSVFELWLRGCGGKKVPKMAKNRAKMDAPPKLILWDPKAQILT